MLVCPKCGAQLEDGSMFCTNCGSSIQNVQKPASQPVGTPVMQNQGYNPGPASAPAPNPGYNQGPAAPSPAPAKICPNCGSMVNATDVVCYNCGTPLAQASAKAPKVKAPKAPGSKKISKPLLIGGIAGVAVIAVVIILIVALSGGKGKEFALYINKDRDLMYTNMSKKDTLSDYFGDEYLVRTDAFLTKNGKLFYRDRRSSNALYYCEISDPKNTAKSVVGNAKNFKVDESGSLITYSDSNGYLYQKSVGSTEEAKRIAKNVGKDFTVTKDGKKVIYGVDETYYYWESGSEEPVRIGKDIDRIVYISENYKTVYFLKNNNLYKWEPGTDDTPKIESDVSYAAVCDSGEMYFLKNNDGQYDLYYKNGNEAEKIGSNVGGFNIPKMNRDGLYYMGAPVVTFAEREDNGDSTYYVAAQNKKESISLQYGGEAIFIAPDGKAVYYYDGVEELSREEGEFMADLYKIDISGNKIGKAEKYDSEVQKVLEVLKNGVIIYRKNFRENGSNPDTCDLYISKKLVNSNVYRYEYDEDSTKLYCISDYNTSSESGTANMYYKDKLSKVGDDVYSMELTVNGNLLYMTDYSRSVGDLWYYDGSSDKIDQDVRSFCVPDHY